MAIPRSLIESSNSKATFSETICSLIVYQPTQAMAGQSLMELLLKWNSLLVFPLLVDFSMCYLVKNLFLSFNEGSFSEVPNCSLR